MQDVEVKIEKWKKCLLDLGKSNRLINFKETKRSDVAIISPSYDILYKKIVNEEYKLSFPFSLKTTCEENENLKTNKTLNEQQNNLKVLRGRAKTSIEEQGINSLYLTFGMIKWKEIDSPDSVISSPLVLVPVTLTMESITEPYVLQLHEDEIVLNPSLVFKFENDFGVVLPEFDVREDDITKYLLQIKEIAEKNDWEVSTGVNLTLLSFLKINMYKDIEDNKDKILSNPIIKALSGDKSEISLIPSELGNFDHDKNSRPIDTYQVVDADSSQQDAILLSKRGISFVLQGPPGTGKSQTITNIIAEAIADGKKVLFVSEKMAALEVVKKRLTEVGIDDFCLTLHSYKANKKEVLNQLDKTLSLEKINLSEDAIYNLAVLEEKRNKLNEYQEQLHEKCMPINISIYEANGRLAKLYSTQEVIFEIRNVETTDMGMVNQYRYLLDEFAKTIGKLSESYSENPWYGSNIPVVTHEITHDIEVNLNKLSLKLKDLTNTYESVTQKTGANIAPTIKNVTTLIKLLDFSSESPSFPLKWLDEDRADLVACAQQYLKLFNEYKEKTSHLLDRYAEDVIKINAKDMILTIDSNMTDVKQYLDNVNYPSDKDIFLKADVILSECGQVKDFMQELYNQSKEISSTIGIKEQNSISSILNSKELIELILKNPQPIKEWFNYGKFQSLAELLEIVEQEQLILKENFKKIRVKYDDSIINIDFNEMLLRFKNDYAYLLKVIGKFNNLSNSLEINKDTLYSFADNEIEKLKEVNLLTSKAIEVSKQLKENIGIISTPTLQGVISLSELIAVIIQNPKPTLIWFDENKEHVVDKMIIDIKNTQEEIDKETKEILIKYNKDIMNIDFKNMLIRFNTDHTSVLKVFNGSYSVDKKTLKGFSKEPSNKFKDTDIRDLLNKISFIKEKEQWLIENKTRVNEMLGDLYTGKDTAWEIVDKSRENFKIIKKYFGVNKIPEQLKKMLLERDTEKLTQQQCILLKITEEGVMNYAQSIFGADVGKQPILKLLEKMNTIANTSIEIKNDFEDILMYSNNTNETNQVTVNDMIEVLTSIKMVNKKRTWFSNNSNTLSENFGKHYKGENTDWYNVKENIEIVKEIINYFDKKQIPSKLVDYLTSSEISQDTLLTFIKNIEDINNKDIVMRLYHLLNIPDTKVVYLKKVIEILDSIENGVNISYSKYDDFSICSKSTIQYENIMTDVILLNRIQEIEATVETASAELQIKFDFEFKGMDTNWETVISSLEYANKFKRISEDYLFSNGYISDICCDKSMAKWNMKYSEKLKEQDQDIKQDFTWYISLFENSEKLYSINIYEILDRIEKSISNLSLLEEWIDFRGIRQQCREIGLSEFVEKVEQMGMPADIIVDTFFKRFYRLWLDVMIPRYEAVYAFRSGSHQSTINEFNALDKSQLEVARLRILEKLINRLPDTNRATSSVDEFGILKREISKQRKIMPLRQLFKEIPNLLPALKPCLMMSPLSVSVYLEAEGYNFDTVIFDEASQVCTEDAIGAIMRGKQVIIAGDSKQLPPTSFFAAKLSDDVEVDDDTEDIVEGKIKNIFEEIVTQDSILEEAINVMPERTLKWHYRSRHEHLIAFSNAKIYNNELITFPSNIEKIADNGVEYIYVEDGVYDRGGKKSNLNEAKRVASLVFDHITKYPERSLGVVTFSQAQQQEIDDEISRLRLENSQYENFFSEDKEHPFFIKNLESVQGDERDTIIFSIGYAKDQKGVMYMNFGPLSRNGGYRRLNVAITRAKYNVKLVGSIKPTDIKIENSNSEGVKMLRQYMEFALNGVSVLKNELQFTNKINNEAPFEEAVYEFLIKNGYNVTMKVGCSGNRIDMAVKHPTYTGTFIMGIECDGATYHSARTARERDRIRQTVLEDIGWTIYRIWSTEWIKDPKGEGNKLLEAVKMAMSNYNE